MRKSRALISTGLVAAFAASAVLLVHGAAPAVSAQLATAPVTEPVVALPTDTTTTTAPVVTTSTVRPAASSVTKEKSTTTATSVPSTRVTADEMLLRVNAAVLSRFWSGESTPTTFASIATPELAALQQRTANSLLTCTASLGEKWHLDANYENGDFFRMQLDVPVGNGGSARNFIDADLKTGRVERTSCSHPFPVTAVVAPEQFVNDVTNLLEMDARADDGYAAFLDQMSAPSFTEQRRAESDIDSLTGTQNIGTWQITGYVTYNGIIEIYLSQEFGDGASTQTLIRGDLTLGQITATRQQ